ncbi:MAG: DUF4198 domain-containing protein [Desulfobulbaceae bacterium]|nr:DUF4198 domain-containing protein [Desulfobulbaceae bacterium]
MRLLLPNPMFLSRFFKWIIIVLLAHCLFVGHVRAHSLFIQSGRFQVDPGKSSPLFFCYGHHFPVDDAIQREKLAYVRVIAPDQSSTDVTLRNERSLHSYLIKYEEPGTYVLTAETVPGYFAMYLDKKGRQRHSLKPLSAFADDAEEVRSSMRSSQWTKAYVFSEKPSEPAPGPLGLPLELVPAANLAELKEGDSLTFQVYAHKKPYSGEGVWDATYMGFSTEPEDMYIPQTKSVDGGFTVPVDHAGRWFVRFFTKNPAPAAAAGEYLTEKQTTSFVFEVRNARKQPKSDSR